MPETMSELRERAAHELRAARHSANEEERTTHRNIANACKALAESEAWLEGRIKPVGNGFRRIRD